MARLLTLSTTVAALLGVGTKASITCRTILTAYADAPQCLFTINSDCSKIRSALSLIYGVLGSNTPSVVESLEAGNPFANAFNAVLLATESALASLEDQLNSLHGRELKRSGLWETSIGRMWDEEYMTLVCGRLGNVRCALATILEVVARNDTDQMIILLNERKHTLDLLRHNIEPRRSQHASSASSATLPPPSVYSMVQESLRTKRSASAGLGQDVLHRIQQVNGYNRWDGSKPTSILSSPGSPSTPSLLSDTEDAYNDSLGPATPRSVGDFGTIPRLDRSSGSSSENSWSLPLSPTKRTTSDTNIPKPVDGRRHFTVDPQVFKDFKFDEFKAFPYEPSSAPDSLPSPPPKSLRRQTLSLRKSYSTLPPGAMSPITPKSRPALSLRKSFSNLSPSAPSPLPPKEEPLVPTLRRVDTTISSVPSSKYPSPPTYTFTAEPTESNKRLSRPSFFKRKSLARISSLTSTIQSTTPSENNGTFSIRWLASSQPTAFQSMSPTSVHPALARTTLTIPFIGSASLIRSAPSNWISAKTNTPIPKAKTDEISITGIVSDGQSTRTVQTTFYTATSLSHLVTLKQRRYSDTALAVIAFSLVDDSSLDKATRKWAPLLRAAMPELPFVFVGFGRTDVTQQDVLNSVFGGSNSFNSPYARVSRRRGVKAAKECGAEMYVECCEDCEEAREKLFSTLVGYATARRLEGGEGRGKGRVFEEGGSGLQLGWAEVGVAY